MQNGTQTLPQPCVVTLCKFTDMLRRHSPNPELDLWGCLVSTHVALVWDLLPKTTRWVFPIFFCAEELKATVTKGYTSSQRLVRQELCQRRRVPTRLAPRLMLTGLHQRFSEGNSTRCPEHSRPSAFPRKCNRMSQQCWHLPCFGKRELPEEICRFIAPAPSRLDGHHTRRHRLEVRSSGNVASLSRLTCANTAPSSSAAPSWASPELRKVMSTANWAPLRQILRQNLDAPLIVTADAQVQVTQESVELHPCPCLTTHSREHPLGR